ncbi:MAG: threonylcarbamoyl-AMP synthase [Anaerolineae bacterium]|nr:threonylcarbamoyl-AMP synthase [Anaerolineae bacterium]
MVTTQILEVDPSAIAAEIIYRAADVIQAGGLVAFPTETVYGLGANALNAIAVRRIFTAKDRPAHDPLIVHLASSQGLPGVVATVPDVAWRLAEHFWPGPLTLVLPRASVIPDEVTAGGPTVAVRVPAHPVAQALLEASGVPIAAPSANRFGRLSPTRASDVLADLAGRVEIILDAGATFVGVESTVLSLVEDPPVILRPGGVSRESLMTILGNVSVREHERLPVQRSPGMLDQHYAPRARLILFRGEHTAVLQAIQREAERFDKAQQRVGVLVATEDLAAFEGRPWMALAPGPFTDLDMVAHRLFTTLRALDAAGVDVILARDFGAAGLGLAIRDRLTRAAGGQIITA